MKRPFGITLIAIFALFSGLFGLCWPILVFMGSTLLGPIFGTVGMLAGIFLIIGPILQLIFAYGAFKLRSWAWYLGLVATGITVIGVIANIFGGGSLWSAFCGSTISIIIFIYLLTPNVRQVFGQGSEQQAPAVPPAPIEPPMPEEQPAQVEPPVQEESPALEEAPASEEQSASEEPPAADDNPQQ